MVLLHCLTIHNAYQKDLSCRYTRTLYQAMTPNGTSHTYTVSLEASSDIVLSAIHKFDSLNNKAKHAVCKCCRLSHNTEIWNSLSDGNLVQSCNYYHHHITISTRGTDILFARFPLAVYVVCKYLECNSTLHFVLSLKSIVVRDYEDIWLNLNSVMKHM